MKLIELSQGMKAIVDDEDYQFLMSFKWHAGYDGNKKTVYAKSCKRMGEGKIKTFRMHRLITKATPGMVVDHINHDTLDNRKSNLRVVTQKENLRNTKLSKRNRSGFCGISFIKKTGKFVARIEVDDKNIYIGSFADKQKAIEARISANKEFGFHENHGQY